TSKPRRRVIISSDEESDNEQEISRNSDILSDDGEVIDDSIVALSDDEGQPPSTPVNRTANGASFVASTPLNKTLSEEEALNETFDRMSVGEKSAVSRSLSNSSLEGSTADRDRSFHGKRVEESPISKRLNAQSDVKSKQALRERLLRKQAIASRGSDVSGDSRSSSLANSTLSPISFKPPLHRFVQDEKSREGSVSSEMDTRSPANKTGSAEVESGDESMERGSESGSASKSASDRSSAVSASHNGSASGGSMNTTKSRDSNASSSPKSDKENETSPGEKKMARKKLNMDEVAGAKIKEEQVKKFLTPRRARIETSSEEEKEEEEEEEKDVKTAPYPNIDSLDDEEHPVKAERSIVEIEDSDEESGEGDSIFNSDDEGDQGPPKLKKEEQQHEEIILSSSSPSPTPPTRQPPVPSRAAPSYSTSSMNSMHSNSGMHPTTVRTHTDGDIATMERDLSRLLALVNKTDMKLPDGGAQLRRKIEELTTNLENARLAQPARRVAPPETKGKLQVIDAPSNPDAYNKQIVDDGLGHKKLMGGVMTIDRMENVKKVTKDSLEKMHKEVTSQPEGEETPTPRGLRVELMGHQKTGLTWMMWREKQQAPGGILADDMGLGKTMSLISLILQAKNDRMEKEDDEKYEEQQAKYKKMCSSKGLAASHSTLVIAPASVIFQWEKEIEKRVKGSRLSVLVFHGPKNKREDRPKKLAKYDIVITTYNIITAELTEKVDFTRDDEETESDDDDARFGKKAAVADDGKTKTRVSKSQISVLTKVHWDRIILDEAHQIKNRNSLISKAVCRLPGRNRWALTGTPVHNNLYDLFSLVRFLRVAPFDELSLWKQYIMDARNGSERLNTLVKSLLLRRLKSQVDTKTNQPLVSLKPKQYEVHHLELDGLEKGIYEMMFKAVQTKVASFMQQQKEEDLFGRVRRRKGEKKEGDDEVIKNPFIGGPRDLDTNNKFQAMSCFLVLLLRLRQAVVHLSLTKEALDLSTFEGLSMDSNEEILDAELSQLSLDENAVEESEGGGKKLATEADVAKCFRQKFLSTKVRVLLDKLDHAVQAGDKCVVVSQWTTVLKIIQYHIEKRDVEYTEITGEIPTADRQERVDSFNRTDGGAQVMLLSLTAGGVGLNLIGGNHLFLVDLHWNPALEAQACDRIYRMGQTKNVFIHKLLTKNSIEESILALQNKKSALAKSVLEGAAKKDLNKLTMADLRFLFDLDGDQKRKEQAEEAAKKAMAALPAPPRGGTTTTHSASSHNYNQAVYGGRQTGAAPSSGSHDVITL
ncbi:hypothetical protein PFISCL1PPCAC_23686, partial [Pristionchus fissidentatus]